MTKPIILGICGGSGSGKTTFVKKLRETFSSAELCIVSQDDYYRKRDEQQIDQNGVTNFDLPTSIDRDAFLRDIKKLISGETIQIQEYTFNNEHVKPRIHEVKSAPVIIVEGLFIFHYEEIHDLLNVRIYIHTDDNLKIIRRIRRDQSERNYPVDDVLYRYENHTMPTYKKYILPYKELADIVVNNNNGFEKAFLLLDGYIKNKINAVLAK